MKISVSSFWNRQPEQYIPKQNPVKTETSRLLTILRRTLFGFFLVVTLAAGPRSDGNYVHQPT